MLGLCNVKAIRKFAFEGEDKRKAYLVAVYPVNNYVICTFLLFHFFLCLTGKHMQQGKYIKIDFHKPL